MREHSSILHKFIETITYQINEQITIELEQSISFLIKCFQLLSYIIGHPSFEIHIEYAIITIFNTSNIIIESIQQLLSNIKYISIVQLLLSIVPQCIQITCTLLTSNTMKNITTKSSLQTWNTIMIQQTNEPRHISDLNSIVLITFINSCISMYHNVHVMSVEYTQLKLRDQKGNGYVMMLSDVIYNGVYIVKSKLKHTNQQKYINQFVFIIQFYSLIYFLAFKFSDSTDSTFNSELEIYLHLLKSTLQCTMEIIDEQLETKSNIYEVK
jgi:hypothetical protein